MNVRRASKLSARGAMCCGHVNYGGRGAQWGRRTGEASALLRRSKAGTMQVTAWTLIHASHPSLGPIWPSDLPPGACAQTCLFRSKARRDIEFEIWQASAWSIDARLSFVSAHTSRPAVVVAPSPPHLRDAASLFPNAPSRRRVIYRLFRLFSYVPPTRIAARRTDERASARPATAPSNHDTRHVPRVHRSRTDPPASPVARPLRPPPPARVASCLIAHHFLPAFSPFSTPRHFASRIRGSFSLCSLSIPAHDGPHRQRRRVYLRPRRPRVPDRRHGASTPRVAHPQVHARPRPPRVCALARHARDGLCVPRAL